MMHRRTTEPFLAPSRMRRSPARQVCEHRDGYSNSHSHKSAKAHRSRFVVSAWWPRCPSRPAVYHLFFAAKPESLRGLPVHQTPATLATLRHDAIHLAATRCKLIFRSMIRVRAHAFVGFA